MEHMSPPPSTNTSLISTLADLITIAGGLLAISVAIWQFLLYRQLANNKKAIEAKQAEIDAIPDKVHGKANQSPKPIVQRTRDKMIAADQAPLKHELELLERNRKFIKDELLFAKR